MSKNVVLGISGGISVYKVCTLVRLLRQSDINVDIIMTEHATKFVTPLTFETLSGNAVICDMFGSQGHWEVSHIALAKKADLLVVAPATANVIAKYACGIADDMLSTTLVATTCPVLMCPAMNTHMYNNVATQHNVAVLQSRGVTFLDSASGELACGDSGKGRLAEPEDIAKCIQDMLYPTQDMLGHNVLVTLGGTAEQIDDVRCITNHSSGKMGSAIVDELVSRGANVTVVAGSHTASINNNAVVYNVVSTQQMYDVVMNMVGNMDSVVMVAAPCDYRPTSVASSKIKGDNITLQLVKNVDIARAVGSLDKRPQLVVFSAETDQGVDNAKAKLLAKNADFAVLNMVRGGAVFGEDVTAISIVDRQCVTSYDTMSKRDASKIIVDRMVHGS